MNLSIVLKWLCLVVANVCLGLAYILAGYWWIVPALLVLLGVWFHLKKRSAFWPGTGILFTIVSLSALGAILELSLPLLIAGCTASLAYWDLANFRESLPVSQPPQQNDALERYHLGSLGMAIAAGLISILIGSSLSLHFSFIVIAVLVLTIAGGLAYAYQFWVRQ